MSLDYSDYSSVPFTRPDANSTNHHLLTADAPAGRTWLSTAYGPTILDIYAPEGSIQIGVFGDDGGQLGLEEISMPSDGVHTRVVIPDISGNYSNVWVVVDADPSFLQGDGVEVMFDLTRSATLPEDDAPSHYDFATEIDLDTPYVSDAYAIYDKDAYRVTVEPGKAYDIAVTDIYGGSLSHTVIREGDFDLRSEPDDQLEFVVSMRSAGEYRVEVTERLLGGLNAETARVLQAGEDFHIDNMQDLAWFQMQVEAGQTYVISGLARDLRLYDADLSLIGTMEANDYIFTASETTTIYAEAIQWWREDAGAIAFDLLNAAAGGENPGSARSIDVRGSVEGVLGDGQTTLWLQTEMTKGDSYQIFLNPQGFDTANDGVGSNFSPSRVLVRMVDMTGDPITEFGWARFNADNPMVLVAQESGPVYLELDFSALRYGDQSGVTYDISLEPYREALPAQVLAMGLLTPGTLDARSDVEIWTLPVDGDSQYTITFNADDTPGESTADAWVEASLDGEDWQTKVILSSGRPISFDTEVGYSYRVRVDVDHEMHVDGVYAPADYTLQMTQEAGDVPGTISGAVALALDVAVAGEANASHQIRDHDVYALDVIAGQRYKLTLDAPDIADDAFLQLDLEETAAVELLGLRGDATGLEYYVYALESGTIHLRTSMTYLDETTGYSLLAERMAYKDAIPSDAAVLTDVASARSLELAPGEIVYLAVEGRDGTSFVSYESSDSFGSNSMLGGHVWNEPAGSGEFTLAPYGTGFVRPAAVRLSNPHDTTVTIDLELRESHLSRMAREAVLVEDGETWTTTLTGDPDSFVEEKYFALEVDGPGFYSLALAGRDVVDTDPTDTNDALVRLRINQVYAPDGQSIARTNSGRRSVTETEEGAAKAGFIAEEAGTYYVSTTYSSHNASTALESVTLDFTAKEVSDISKMPRYFADQLELDTPFEFDASDLRGSASFQIDLEGGEFYRVTVTGADDGGGTWADPSGVSVRTYLGNTSSDISSLDAEYNLRTYAWSADAGGSTKAATTFLAEESQTYFFGFYNVDETEGTTGTIVVERLENDAPDPDVMLSEGVNTITLDDAFVSQWFKFQGTYGQRYRVEIDIRDIERLYTLDLINRAFDFEGEKYDRLVEDGFVSYTFDAGSSEHRLPFLEFMAHEVDPDVVETFDISITKDPYAPGEDRLTAIPIELGDTQVMDLNDGTQRLWVSFDAKAGVTYHVDIPLNQSWTELEQIRDDSGLLLGSGPFVTLAQDQTVQVEVTSTDHYEFEDVEGEFRIIEYHRTDKDDATDANTWKTLSPGKTSGRLNQSGDVDVFKLEGGYGYRIKVASTDPLMRMRSWEAVLFDEDDALFSRLTVEGDTSLDNLLGMPETDDSFLFTGVMAEDTYLAIGATEDDLGDIPYRITIQSFASLVGTDRGDTLMAQDLGNAGSGWVDGMDGADVLSMAGLDQRAVVNMNDGWVKMTNSEGQRITVDVTNVERVIGTSHNDIFHLDRDTRKAKGEAGKDTFFVHDNSNATRIEGGAGKDTINFKNLAYKGAYVQLDTGTYGTTTGTAGVLNSIESVVGSNFADHIYGNRKNNALRGLDGDDVFFYSAGRDVLRGGAGDDELIVNEQSGEFTFEEQADRLLLTRGDDVSVIYDDVESVRFLDITWTFDAA